MATSSITKQFVIADPEACRRLRDAYNAQRKVDYRAKATEPDRPSLIDEGRERLKHFSFR